MKKIDYYKDIIGKNIDLFQCPKCNESFCIQEKTLVCNSGHCYDIASKGYLNFMTGAKGSIEQYDCILFDSRGYIFKKGFFNELLKEIEKLINEYCKEPSVIADIGCGEGSALEYITRRSNSVGIGIDISKHGINMAASRPQKDILWTVGDLTKVPFKEKAFDVIINMLSPANYYEFDRTINDGGMIIKVLPGESYLKQMREFFYKGGDKESYSNVQTAGYFRNRYEGFAERNISYHIKTDEEYLFNLARMSPLASGKSAEEIDLFKRCGIEEMCADFKILIGFATK